MDSRQEKIDGLSLLYFKVIDMDDDKSEIIHVGGSIDPDKIAKFINDLKREQRLARILYEWHWSRLN